MLFLNSLLAILGWCCGIPIFRDTGFGAAALALTHPRPGAVGELAHGGVELEPSIQQVVQVVARRAAALDAAPAVALRVVARMAAAFGLDPLPDGLLLGELQHGASSFG